MTQALAERLTPYVPRVVLRQLVEDPARQVREVDGTVVFVDLSGFTKLGERLTRLGREGAEYLVTAIDETFAELLAEAYANGGSLLKFGGDALLLLFEGPEHVERACRSAADMRRRLRTVGRIETRGARITLRMSVGIHTDRFPLFLVGQVYRELLTTGPAWTTVVRMEGEADAGEILLSPTTAARLPARCVGPAKGPGRLLAASPTVQHPARDDDRWRPGAELLAACLPAPVLEHVSGGHQPPEHRNATVAFVRYEGTDALIAEHGAPAVAEQLAELVDDLAEATGRHRVTLLGSDVDADGGKFMLCAGAPTATVDDEERILLAMRAVVEKPRRIPVRIGVNRGPVFAAAVGTPYRRTYTTMGNTTNLAARLTSRAAPGTVYVTASVLDRSATAFDVETLPPFMVKGKARPIQAYVLGPPLGRRARAVTRAVAERFPLVGRGAEMEVLIAAVAGARAGEGRLVEIVSEPGLGKTRLLEELVDAAPDLRRLHGSCEAYTASIPYSAWREPLLQALGIPGDARAEQVATDLVGAVAAVDPELEPWLPLLAVPFDVPMPETPQVRRLAAEFRPAQLQRAVVRLLRAVLPDPTLLLFEDVHLMDRASSDLLARLLDELPTMSWLVAASRRDEDTGFVAPAADALVRLEPAPLSPVETLALAEAVTENAPMPPSTLAQIAERSAGSPQFLRDLLRAAADGVEDLPDSIEAAAMARIDRLAAADRAIVRRAAVVGVAFDARLLKHVLDPGTPEPDAATWQRLTRYFADEGDGRWRFRRAIVREVAYAGLPFATRRRLHGELGSQIAAELGAAVFDQAAILSLHFFNASDYASAWHFARAAGDRARDEYAYADAAALYRRALDAGRYLDVPPHELAAVWEAVGEAHSHTGEPKAAAAAFTAARRAIGDESVRQAELLHRHAVLDLDAGRVRQAVRWCTRGLRQLDGLDGPEAQARRAELVATLATVRWRAGRYDDAAALCRRAIAEAEESGDDAALARACSMLDTSLAYAGHTVDGQHFRRALEIYERLGDLDRQAQVLNNMGIAAYWAGRWTEAVELYRRGADASRAAGDESNATYGDGNIGELLSDQGRTDEAIPLLRRSLQVFRGTGYEWNAMYVTALLGRAATRAGDPDHARDLLDEAVAGFTALGTAGDAAWADALRAEAEVHAGHSQAALERVDRLLLDNAGTGRLAPLLHRVRGLALAQSGNRAGAEGALGASLVEARLQDEAYEVALTLHVALALQLRYGDRPDPRLTRERDRFLARLGIVRLPLPPVAPAAVAADAAGA